MNPHCFALFFLDEEGDEAFSIGLLTRCISSYVELHLPLQGNTLEEREHELGAHSVPDALHQPRDPGCVAVARRLVSLSVDLGF